MIGRRASKGCGRIGEGIYVRPWRGEVVVLCPTEATTCSTSALYTSSGPLQKVWSGAGGEHRHHRTKLWETAATTMLRHRRIDALYATRAVDKMIKAQEHCSRMPAEGGGGQRQRWCHTHSPRRNAAGPEQHEEGSSYSAISARVSGGVVGPPVAVRLTEPLL
ncbi:hypothetical protein BC826DRAFT_1003173 [Russula brevipes]|nr:hypothetical protein BC826DRAFT_1003173 [Russula brevipes]